MKTTITKIVSGLLFLYALFSVAGNLIAQDECKVLKPEISGTYTGKCKKGLANGKGKAVGADIYEGQFRDGLPSGKGTYTWANGDIYNGEWKEGYRDGKGSYKFKVGDKDSTLTGLWIQDQYYGPMPIAPRVISKTSIDRYTIYKQSDIKYRVLIDFMQNGMRNTGITNLLMSTSNGTETTLGNLIGYDYITFPVRIKVSYITPNKLHTTTFHADFEFEISEPGDWRVEITN